MAFFSPVDTHSNPDQFEPKQIKSGSFSQPLRIHGGRKRQGEERQREREWWRYSGGRTRAASSAWRGCSSSTSPRHFAAGRRLDSPAQPRSAVLRRPALLRARRHRNGAPRRPAPVPPCSGPLISLSFGACRRQTPAHPELAGAPTQVAAVVGGPRSRGSSFLPRRIRRLGLPLRPPSSSPAKSGDSPTRSGPASTSVPKSTLDPEGKNSTKS